MMDGVWVDCLKREEKEFKSSATSLGFQTGPKDEESSRRQESI